MIPVPVMRKTHELVMIQAAAGFFMKTKYEMSQDKTEFLAKEQDSSYPGYQVSVLDLEKIVKHYQEKYGIRLIINGTTPKYQSLIKERQVNFEQQKQQFLELKYAKFLQIFFQPPNLNGANSPFSINKHMGAFIGFYEEIYNKVLPFLDAKGKIISGLSLEELRQLNEACQELSCKGILDAKINEFIERNFDYMGLTARESASEIKDICDELQEGEVLGYFFTGQRTSGRCHFDLYICLPGKAIRPIFYNTALIRYHDLGGMFHLNFPFVEGSFFTPDLLKLYSAMDLQQLIPQADRTSCGTLTMMYAKELLKDDARGLKEFTLSFTYYNEKGEKEYFFLPSPQVLRYSQISLYNEALKAIVSHENDGQAGLVRIGAKKYMFHTVEKILIQSFKIALEKEDADVLEENQKIWDMLPSFQEKWQESYKEMVAKRAVMHQGVNKYLLYSTHRMSHIASEQSINNEADADRIILR
ncbi:TPA: lpg2538 family Dot/Icm T4SS effector [Legionella pneumophila]|uniref:lpg2538 family Dot/Icm T4SS effector n=1 Tax=Legionella pneumophila TaxID=446 RepID=UPI000975A8CA|nr:lpg2538 family Dot/Icm T4SS effector [Legionella pneumophila]HAT6823683.1 lpg2538 family Dot/Icm T4SS effector [Legionella pneumophila]HAT6829788.1 lpg2538 family Dot/Icm T4SS effector [Legionella pneumophila]HAT6894377.1 lpg2538 family Dot/Icm T4SS effector [Legionella pneumophila]HAT6990248.1 lpg2538 family Dot/Icm T4SS effector [Legionella pneumophila]HAT6993015.1 lpg2538 family Dot/Icm T4SS effector [Legionella pneumophila]